MKAILLLCVCLCFCVMLRAQSYSVSASSDRQYFCNASQTMKVSGRVTSFSGGTYKGFKYHFYYLVSGIYQEIGYYSVTYSGSTPFTTYGNIQSSYFDGSQIGNPVQIPQGSNSFWVTIDVPYAAFPNNNTGQQLAMDVEAIDQGGNTTTHSSKVFYSVPLLYTNPVVLSLATISASAASVCGGSSVLLSGSPNYSSNGFSYDWYKDGTALVLGDLTGTLTAYSAGAYYAIVGDACQTATSNTVVIGSDNVPATPTVTPASNVLLCNGNSTTLTATGSNITWNNGTTGNTLNTSTAGTYYAFDQNGCGNSSNSNQVVVTAGNCPTPVPGTSFFICPGLQKTLDAGGGYDSYLWNTGAITQTISVGPGTYSVTVSKNGCSAVSAVVTVSYYTVNPPIINASGNVVFCNGGSVTLTASGGVSYLWNTGATGSSINVTTAGSYLVTATDGNGCQSNSNTITTTVHGLPTATIGGSVVVCQNASAPSVQFNGSGGDAPYTFTYAVNGGASQTITTVAGSGVSVAVPTGVPGSFVYSLIGVSESSSTSCSNTASGSATVVVNPLPTASISGSTAVCQNGAAPSIVFTGAGGTAPYTFTYTINGGSNQTVSGNTVSVSVPTGTVGSFVYTLVSVQDASATACSNGASGTATVVVNPLPTATISGSTTVCQNGAAPAIVFSGANGTAPYTFTYTVNGGANQTVTTVSGNTISVAVPTVTAGSFVYTLVSVQDASSTACSNAASGTATVVVNPLPTAMISGTTAVCQDAASPEIVFTGSGGTAPYTFTYIINGGSNQTVSTTSGNSVSVSVPTNVSGTFTYSLVAVQDASSTACINAAGGAAVVTVHPRPAIAVIVAPNTHLCNGIPEQITVLNPAPGQSYEWYQNGVLLKTTTTDNIMNDQPATFKVVSISDKGCRAANFSNTITITTGSIAPPIITGYLHVCEGGKTLLAVNAARSYEVWRWTDPPDQQTLGTDSSFFAYAGQYQVLVMKQGCYDSATITVAADDTVFPAGKIKLDKDSVDYGGRVIMTAAVVGASEYRWDFGNGHQLVSVVNEVAENYYSVGDSIAIRLTAVSERNCVTDFTAYLKVRPQNLVVKKDDSFSGNLKDWNVFPIPFQDHLKVSVILNRSQDVRLDLFTVEGKWVRSWIKKGVQGENLFSLEGIDRLTANVFYYIVALYNGAKHFDKVFKY